MYIALEGIDGAGTTTQAQLLVAWLKQQYPECEVIAVCEPTNDGLGRKIREYLQGESITPFALQMLFCADRIEQLETVILPALERGAIVVSDRCHLSTLAYAAAMGVPITGLAALWQDMRAPDLVLYLNVPAAMAMLRLGVRDGGDGEIFEHEEILERVIGGYQQAIETVDVPIVELDGTLGLEEVAIMVQHAMQSELGVR